MRFKTLAFGSLVLVSLLFLSGCASQKQAENLAKSSQEGKAFLEKNPGAEIKTSFLKQDDTVKILHQIEKECAKQMHIRDYWIVTMSKGSEKMTLYLDSKASEVLCVLPLGKYSDKCGTDNECSDNDSCTRDTCTGSPKQCTHDAINICRNNDSCCPIYCSNENDSDCPAADQNSYCQIHADCDDNSSCTVDYCEGVLGRCKHSNIVSCKNYDKCCPTGCNSAKDSDCVGVTVPCTTDSQCNDSNPATIDRCDLELLVCGHTPTTVCTGGDNYCPANCNAGNDSDCRESGKCYSNPDCEDSNSSTSDSCDLSSNQCTHALKNCTEMQGTICLPDKFCAGSFANASDGSRCCIGVCSSCSTDVQCDDSNSDTLDACNIQIGITGICMHPLKTCAQKNGTICTADQSCPVAFVYTADTERCCPQACT